ncbi:MAG: hypothetical protein QOI64_2319 [Solirubrobacteraceae bacterium]|nr:hypothetical protein [Solirubrobacteraceae bacterium]
MLDDAAQELARQQVISGDPGDGLVVKMPGVTGLDRARDVLSDLLPGVVMTVKQLFPEGSEGLEHHYEVTLPGCDLLAAQPGLFDIIHALEARPEIDAVDPVLDIRLSEQAAGMAGPEIVEPPATAAPAGPDADWHLRDINAYGAWKYSEDSGRPSRGDGSTIAFVDTGATDHLSTKLEILWNQSVNTLEPGRPIWDRYAMEDGPPDVPFLRELKLVNPGHGTSTAAVGAGRAALTDVPMSGVAPLAMAKMYRAVDSVVIGPTNFKAVADAVEAAARTGCQVISMSLGTPFRYALIADAMAYAVASGSIVVAAAGNILSPLVFEGVKFPACDPNCIAAAGSGQDRLPYYKSCWGPEVTISSPCEGIWVPWKEWWYELPDHVGVGTGTSYSSAGVAGVAALWGAHHGWLNLHSRYRNLHEEFKSQIARSCAIWIQRDHGPGIVNAAQLLCGDFHAVSFEASEDQELDVAASEQRSARSALSAQGVHADDLRDLGGAFLAEFGKEITYLSVLNAAAREADDAGGANGVPARYLRPSARLSRECPPDVLEKIA